MEREANYVAVGAFILLVIGHGRRLRALVHGRERRPRLRAVRDLLHRQRQRPGSRQPGALPRRRRRPRAPPVDRQATTPAASSRSRRSTANAPISAATRASLGLQGVTGLLYINLKEAPNVDKSVPLPQGERYPVIQSVASDFDVFLAEPAGADGPRQRAARARRSRVLGRESRRAGRDGEEPAHRDRRPAADVAERRAAGR